MENVGLENTQKKQVPGNTNTGEAYTEDKKTARSEKRKGFNAAALGRVFLILLIILLSLVVISSSPIFSISEIDVFGINYYNENQIIDKSGLIIGQNGFLALKGESVFSILSLRCGDAEKSIVEACPYVKKVNAKYSLPGRIIIEIEERSKSVVVPYQDLGLLVDEEGFVVDIIKNYQDSGLPIVRGIAFDSYSLGNKLAVENDRCLDTVITLISALRQADRDSADKLSYVVSSIDISDLKNIKFFIGDVFVVNLGDGSEIYYRVSTLKEIYYTGLTNGERGLIDFSLSAKAVFIPEPVITSEG
jgi:hypothetical protein